MKYVAAALIAPFAFLELLLRFVLVIPLAVTVIGLILLAEEPRLAELILRPVLLPAIVKALDK